MMITSEDIRCDGVPELLIAQKDVREENSPFDQVSGGAPLSQRGTRKVMCIPSTILITFSS
jgi:hypothetical protein